MLRLCSHSSRTLSGEACPTSHLRPLKVAPCMATCRVIGQESAEAIVGAGRCHLRSGNWKQARYR
jgi:hypothetical protein